MKTPGRNRLKEPTSCRISDLMNSMRKFVDENPTWWEDADMTRNMLLAFTALRNMSEPSMVTDDEYEFVMNIHRNIEESTRP